MRTPLGGRPTAGGTAFRGLLLTLISLLAVACSDADTPSQVTGVAPGDRFEKVLPDQVSDLSARSLNHRAVELTWTQVQDGRSMPAQYQVRVLDGPGGWEQGSIVRTGSCDYPVRGAAVGSSLTCVVDGLEAEKDYHFIVGSERPGIDGLVVGTPSQATAAVTRGAPRILIPATAEVVSGLSYEGTVGQALQKRIEVVLRDSAGAPMGGVPVIWASGEGGGATAGPVSVSDEAGRVRTVWTLGPQAGTQTLEIRVDGLAETRLVAEAAPGPVDQIRITADTVTMGVGEETTVMVQGWDEFGNEVEELPVEWETSNSEIVAVSSDGVIRSEGWGWVLIRTWILDRWRKTRTEDSTVVVVEADPSAITDLRVDGAGEDWLALTWGDVDDGTGKAANYEVRVGSRSSSWSQAAAVSAGSCASAEGSAIGGEQSCTITGLENDRQYDAHVRAYRVKNGSRVYGAAASASGRTLAPPPAAASGVAPESGVDQTGTVGERLPSPVVVRVVDEKGQPVTGASVVFTASGDGHASPSRVDTDNRGRATVQWTLGTQAGRQSLVSALESATAGRGVAASTSDPVTISATARAGAAARLTIAPSALQLKDGGTGSLSVRAVDAYDNVTSTNAVTWSSSDTRVATVTQAGRVSAAGAGDAAIEARVGEAVAAATVAVEAAPVTEEENADPDQITDVRVTSTTETSVVVEYTEVDDGTGRPAVAQIRYALSPMGWGWGQATVLTGEDCDSPIIGNRIGSTRRCVIDGLDPGTSYDVQMVSWRVVNGTNLFAPLSNIATGRTSEVAAPQGPTVAKVVTSPASFTLEDVGRTYPLMAVAYDSRDNVVVTPISWTSSNSSVATVTNDGTVRAVGAGTAMIIATTLCCAEADTSYVTVNQVRTPDPPPATAGQAWYVQDWNYGSVQEMLAESHVGNAGPSGRGGRLLLLRDAGGPGFNRAVRVEYYANAGGEAQVGVDLVFPDAARDKPREIWFEYYARWSANWDVNGPYSGNPDHKHLFLFDQEVTGLGRWEHMVGTFGRNVQMLIAGSWGPGGGYQLYEPDMRTLWDGNWHRIRCHARMATRDGVWDCEMGNQRFSWGMGNTSRGPQYYFNQMALSRNMNRGTDEDITLDFGPITVYTTDPNW